MNGAGSHTYPALRMPSAITREACLDDLATRSGDPDEFVIKDYEGRYYKAPPKFSHAVNIRTDFEDTIRQVVEKYMDSHAP